jgi:hypothetical protein
MESVRNQFDNEIMTLIGDLVVILSTPTTCFQCSFSREVGERKVMTLDKVAAKIKSSFHCHVSCAIGGFLQLRFVV